MEYLLLGCPTVISSPDFLGNEPNKGEWSLASFLINGFNWSWGYLAGQLPPSLLGKSPPHWAQSSGRFVWGGRDMAFPCSSPGRSNTGILGEAALWGRPIGQSRVSDNPNPAGS